jgi:hypothetical protein
MRDLYLAWRYSGGRLDPYRTAHVLGEDYRPLDDPDDPPMPPKSHRRIRNVLIGFALMAEAEELERLSAAPPGL